MVLTDSHEESNLEWRGPPVVLQQLSASGWLRTVLWRDEVDSTNTLAKQLICDGQIATPTVIVAKSQTAGRGRLGRSWFADSGTLTFSVILGPEQLHESRVRWPQLALVAGLAVCDTLSSVFESDHSVSLKWPNDVYLNGRKVAGILIETAGSDDHVVVGIGMNVSTDIARSPEDIQTRATSIAEHLGQALPTLSVLPDVTERLRIRVSQWKDSPESIAADFAEVCLLSGRIVRVNTGSETIEGECRGIGNDGELKIECDGTIVSLRSGEVVSWAD